MLDDLGLEPALRWCTERQAALAGLQAEVRADPLEQRLDPMIETECFRVAQEALTNVVKHAKARTVTVELTKNDDDGQLHLSVRDDGVGFDVASLREQAVRGASLGLLSMEERATLAGGGLEYHSTPGQGTEVHAWFPLKWAHPAVLIGAYMNTTSNSNPSTKSIRVLLADDHTLVRAGIRALLEKLPGVEVAGEASDGREVIDLIKAHQPDVVLMDISMPGLNGLQALARITRDFPQVRVIILSMHPNDEYVMQALKSGASGYLLKRAATAELPVALKSVVGGEIYLSREINSQFLKKFPLQQIARSTTPLEQLTSRQREILQLLAEGQTTKAIASILKISDKTVEYHRAKLMAALKIFDVPGLVRFAMRTGLISQEC